MIRDEEGKEKKEKEGKRREEGRGRRKKEEGSVMESLLFS